MVEPVSNIYVANAKTFADALVALFVGNALVANPTVAKDTVVDDMALVTADSVKDQPVTNPNMCLAILVQVLPLQRGYSMDNLAGTKVIPPILQKKKCFPTCSFN
ncbi:hypothetical protein ACH5RR_026158 [Cinchona calisaya]|uniref:Uncharacterized protein n=1 Tax=Cinchona calisaya TaxID=153742 RepID=A0ABD2Z1Q8_9GENT